MAGFLNVLKLLFAPIIWLLKTLRWLWILVLTIGLPFFIYLTFIADEPVFSVEDDVQLGQAERGVHRRLARGVPAPVAPGPSCGLRTP